MWLLGMMWVLWSRSLIETPGRLKLAWLIVLSIEQLKLKLFSFSFFYFWDIVIIMTTMVVVVVIVAGRG